jgi:hypothetical protein
MDIIRFGERTIWIYCHKYQRDIISCSIYKTLRLYEANYVLNDPLHKKWNECVRNVHILVRVSVHGVFHLLNFYIKFA